MDKKSLLCAYGYLWMFQGDAGADKNAHFAFEARRQIGSLLTKEERGEGITMARALTKANGLPFKDPSECPHERCICVDAGITTGGATCDFSP